MILFMPHWQTCLINEFGYIIYELEEMGEKYFYMLKGERDFFWQTLSQY